MGCTPSKSAGIYSQEKVCRELDTSSTYVPNLKSSLSTPEKPRLSEETSNGRQAFLNIPCRDVHGRSLSQSSFFDRWGSAGSISPSSSCCPNQFSPTPDLRGDSGCCGTT